MKEIEEEDQREQEVLRARIMKLETDVEQYHQTLMSWQDRTQSLEKELLEERNMRETVQRELAALRGHQPALTDAVPLLPRNKSRSAGDTISGASGAGSKNPVSAGEVAMGCGNCSISTRCECIEQAFDMGNIISDTIDSSIKRPHSPLTSIHNKRPRHEDTNVKPELEALEIDFTSKHQSPNTTTTMSSSSIPGHNHAGIENCGFCEDGTACLCAELAAENSTHNNPRIAHLLSQPSEAGPNTDPAANPAITSILPASADKTCKNGPGTCTQCQSDATSTLFCKSLAATRSGPSELPIPKCQASGDDPSNQACGNPTGCCRSTASQVVPFFADRSSTQAITGPTLSCADAFTTLSRHPAFDKATGELGTWLPRLATLPKVLEGRTAFEVEAASVMGVLRFFDRRFGSNGSSAGPERTE